MDNTEQLGTFYLGREFDFEKNEMDSSPLLYTSSNLCTHGIVVGMTGSGKTGLCLSLLEEAGLDRIPAIAIDPKGDISNLLLTFPELRPADFEPWVDPGQAQREGMTSAEFAAHEARKWKAGLADWGIGPDRIQKLRDNVELRLYTPGSTAGRPLSILRSFSAPAAEYREDPDQIRERIASTAAGLLSLLGIDADPVRSREHILISRLLEDAWTAAVPSDLDIGKLIQRIQKPPFERVGVMDLDTFFPAKDRMQLALSLNNLLASPSFASWMEGEPLDVKRLLYTDEGKPVISVLSIAHLSDSERMFFVTLLLNEIVSWIRAQPGTSSLRAILYMDEIYGYFPPTQNPPSKKPMLTLLKQARAYGLGILLGTQNPVDLDYKGLSNTGTWFLGRLQTERDKLRVLDGLEGASVESGAQFDRARIDRILSGLGKRRFYMNNIHEDKPVIFGTRWAMSYLRGPLTREQVRQLVAPLPPASAAPSPAAEPGGKVEADPLPAIVNAETSDLHPSTEPDPRSEIPANVPQWYLPVERPLTEKEQLVYRPGLVAVGRLHFVRASYKVDQWREWTWLAHWREGLRADQLWERADRFESPLELLSEPTTSTPEFAAVGDDLKSAKAYSEWERSFKSYLYREQRQTVWKCVELKRYSTPPETLGDFKIALEQEVSELRDREVEKIKQKFDTRFQRIRDQIRRAEHRVEVEREQYETARTDSFYKWSSTLISGMLGRRGTRTATSARASKRAAKQKADIGRAREELEARVREMESLNAEFERELNAARLKANVNELQFEDLLLAPRKSDLAVLRFGLCWLPWKIDLDGKASPIY